MDQTDIQQVSQQDTAQPDVIEALAQVFGPAGILTSPEDCARYASDQSGLHGTPPLAVIRPALVHDVSEAMAICSRYRIGVVPQGGRTGLSGGACSPQDTVVL